MNKLLSCLAVSAALALPGLASARPVTVTTTLKNYGGDGAYLAVYLTDASGAHVRTLWVAGAKSPLPPSARTTAATAPTWRST